MGSYSELHLGRLFIGRDKREINPLVMTLFRESDKRIVRVEPGSAEALEYGDETWQPDQPFDRVRYECSRDAARDRLDLMGFTAPTAIRALDIAIEEERQRRARWKSELHVALPPDYVDASAIALTADSWMQGLGEIYRSGHRPTFASDPALTNLSPVLRYMLGSHVDGWYGFPGNDVRHAIRLALEICDSGETLSYDLTDLVFGGYYDSFEDLHAHADYLLTEDFVSSRRIVVLTEGATDKWILERSLSLLYPHLSEFFTFMDFEGTRMPGGAGVLANIVKAFIGAGIINRTVALFDNDTAARNALRTLDRIAIPQNIAVVRFPDLGLATDYPTLGPAGAFHMNVNGLATSIELYLGRDCLTSDSGEFRPVQWRGYDDVVGQYQGEIVGKSGIHECFRARLRDCENDAQNIDKYDWSGIRLIIDQLRGAFHDSDQAALVELERLRA